MKDVAGPGRGGRMSRQRKREAVLRLLRGEDLDTVSRSLGVTAATLSAWREAFLAAGEASLTTRPATGAALETERLKARLGEMLLERELLEAKIAVLQALWPGAHLPRLARGPGERVPPAQAATRPAAPGSCRTAAGSDARRRDPRRPGRQPLPW
jgi:transposase